MIAGIDLAGVVVAPIPGLIAGVAADVGEDVAVVVIVSVAVWRMPATGDRQRERRKRAGPAFESSVDVQPEPQRKRDAVGGIQIRLQILLGGDGGGKQERAGDRHGPISVSSIHGSGWFNS